jgi:hypothetical protein
MNPKGDHIWKFDEMRRASSDSEIFPAIDALTAFRVSLSSSANGVSSESWSVMMSRFAPLSTSNSLNHQIGFAWSNFNLCLVATFRCSRLLFLLGFCLGLIPIAVKNTGFFYSA